MPPLADTVNARPLLRAAALLLVGYGVVVMLNAGLAMADASALDVGRALRATVRAGGMALLAWGLTRGWRWAWWVSVVAAAFFFLAGVTALVMTELIPAAAPSLPRRGLILLVLGSTCLGGALGTLFHPRVRRLALDSASPAGET